MDFKYKRKYVAQNGEPGDGKRCTGKSAPDLVIRVPFGTVVYDADTGRLICDLSDKEPFIVAKGGKGGWGNTHFATPTRQVPMFARKGYRGQEFNLRMELKLIADVGLLGFPNVGKSTLLSVVSAARPKIADYHFTTLSPNLGVVYLGEGESFVMADIPGVIEGAAEGAGLGHEFLRHVERCRLLLHIVDASGSESRDPVEDLLAINAELSRFSEKLAALPQIIVANKCDIPESAEHLAQLEEYASSHGMQFFAISAATTQNVSELMKKTYAELSKLPPVLVYEPDPEPVFDEKKPRETKIESHDGLFIVEGDWLYNLVGSVNFADSESLQYFQRVLERSGVIQMLRDAGANDGDTVSVYDFQFEFIN